MTRNEPRNLGNARASRATEKALLCVMDDAPDAPLWVPKSVIHATSEINGRGDEGDLIVEAWWANKHVD